MVGCLAVSLARRADERLAERLVKWLAEQLAEWLDGRLTERPTVAIKLSSAFRENGICYCRFSCDGPHS